jgi:hypothetical protein
VRLQRPQHASAARHGASSANRTRLSWVEAKCLTSRPYSQEVEREGVEPSCACVQDRAPSRRTSPHAASESNAVLRTWKPVGHHGLRRMENVSVPVVSRTPVGGLGNRPPIRRRGQQIAGRRLVTTYPELRRARRAHAPARPFELSKSAHFEIRTILVLQAQQWAWTESNRHLRIKNPLLDPRATHPYRRFARSAERPREQRASRSPTGKRKTPPGGPGGVSREIFREMQP